MRLWHYQLLPYLPRLQLISRWRECCCIAKNIAEKGAPNHILVNKIMDYPIDHFVEYSCNVCMEMVDFASIAMKMAHRFVAKVINGNGNTQKKSKKYSKVIHNANRKRYFKYKSNMENAYIP